MSRFRLRSAVFLVALALAPGCGDDGPAGPDASAGNDASGSPDATVPFDGAPGPDAGGGEPIFEVAAASILVAENRWPPGGAYADVRAGVWSEPPVFHRELARDGFCRLLAYDPTFCGTCDYGELCTPEGVCEPPPTLLSVGTITLSGLKAAVTLSYAGSYYMVDQGSLPGELFDAGDSISASAPGDAFAAIDVSTSAAPTATPTLSGDQLDELRLVDGADFTVTWTPADADSRVRLTLNSPNGSHGMPAERIIECDAPDTGSLVIPQALVEAFPEQPRLEICVGHDCPPSTFLHYRRGIQDTATGQAELIVGSKVVFYLVHEVL